MTNCYIKPFQVTYKERGVVSGVEKTIVVTYPSLTVCNLTAGAYYDVEIVGRSLAGYGNAKTITVSTEQPDPPIPLPPEPINRTDSSIAVTLYPVVQTSSIYIYRYLLSVDDVTSRMRRAVSMSNGTCPGVTEIPGTVVKNFTRAEMLTKAEFIVGDGQLNGVYENKVLTKDHYYDIYFVITSYFENICKYNYVKTTETIQAAAIKAPVIEPAVTPTDNSAWIIALIVIIIVIIIAAVVLVLVCWCRNRQAEQKYVPYANEKDDFDLKVYRIDDYNPHKYWNTIYSLRESRYITAGLDHLPPNAKQITNGGPVGVANGGLPISFQDEFSNLPHGPQSTIRAAKSRENDTRNRFSHLLPYDHSRVMLHPDVNSNSDYINANFIKGYKHQRAFIAAQSPFDEETVLDFWRMIYQYEVRVIVMMSNLIEDNIVKCTQYWPDNGRVMYGHFILDLVDMQEYSAFSIRTLKIRTKDDRDWQMLYIFDLTYWPEHGVPDDPIPLLEMRRKVNVYQSGQAMPIVVHCGTGVSRSGVYIAIDSLLEQYEADGRISVFSFVRKMRKDRPAMVRTLKQYIFIYESIFEAMHAGDTWTGPDDLKDMYHRLTRKNPVNRHSYLHGQFRSLEEFTRKLFPTTCSAAFLPANINKNRFVEIVPPDMYRPILTTPGGVGRTDYVNAVFLDSHRQEAHYLITQSPLHTTVIDFWKLVYDHDVHTIVMMEPMKYEDDTCAEYWPEDHMKQYEPFFVETADVYQQENITIRNLNLTCMSNPKVVRQIRQFQFNAWSDSEFIPKSKSMLLDVIDLVNDWQVVKNNDTTPIMVHCKDGATHSGLFIAVSLLCEKVQDEGEVDVFHSVKHLKVRRSQIIDTLVSRINS